MRLRLVHVELADSNAFVGRVHRHHDPVLNHRFSLGAHDGETLRGVAIVGRPVAHKINQWTHVEVLRLATDGTKNACSFLYGACARAAQALGYEHILTYTLASEGGASLRAVGWDKEKEVEAAEWTRKKRPRIREKDLFGNESKKALIEREDKVRWGRKLCDRMNAGTI